MAQMLWETSVVTLAKGAVAAGTSEVLTAVEDMQDFDEIEWLVMVGTVTTANVTTYAVKENTASSTSSPTPTAVPLLAVSGGATTALTAGNMVITDSGAVTSNKVYRINVSHQALTKRYVFLSWFPATANSVLTGIVCRKIRKRSLPVTQDASVYSYGYAGI